MRFLIKLLIVAAVAAAVTAIAGRRATGRRPRLRTIAAGTVLLTAAVLVLDAGSGW